MPYVNKKKGNYRLGQQQIKKGQAFIQELFFIYDSRFNFSFEKIPPCCTCSPSQSDLFVCPCITSIAEKNQCFKTVTVF